MSEELEQSDGKKVQLIEIYKVHTELVNNITNRRVTINRFYTLLMSAVTLLFPAFFKLPTEIQEFISTEHLIMAVGLLGMILSFSWLASIDSNLRQGMIKYEVLKGLEDKLDYQFFKEEWGFLEKYRIGRTYWEASYIEVLIPFVFFAVFWVLFRFGASKLPDRFGDRFYFISLFCISVPGSFFFRDALRFLVIDMKIRGFMKGWSDREVKRFSHFFPVLMASVLFVVLVLFRFTGCHKVVGNKLKYITEKTSEMFLEEDTNEQIIVPDEKKGGAEE